MKVVSTPVGTEGRKRDRKSWIFTTLHASNDPNPPPMPAPQDSTASQGHQLGEQLLVDGLWGNILGLYYSLGGQDQL